MTKPKKDYSHLVPNTASTQLGMLNRMNDAIKRDLLLIHLHHPHTRKMILEDVKVAGWGRLNTYNFRKEAVLEVGECECYSVDSKLAQDVDGIIAPSRFVQKHKL